MHGCAPDTLPHPYFFTRTLFPVAELSRLIEPRAFVRARERGRRHAGTDVGGATRALSDVARKLEPIAAISWLEMRSYMVNTLLRDTDSVSMAQSLEVRVPLLDTPLVEFVASLPDAARLRPGMQKALLAEAIGDIFPKQVFEQRKRTFTLPWKEWLRGPLRARISSVSLGDLSPALTPHVHANGVKSVWQDFIAGKTIVVPAVVALRFERVVPQ